MTLLNKILAIGIVIAFMLGMFVEYKFHLATETVEARQETKQAQKGQNNIIEFHQDLQKVYVKVKEPCLNKPLPDDVKRLLK